MKTGRTFGPSITLTRTRNSIFRPDGKEAPMRTRHYSGLDVHCRSSEMAVVVKTTQLARKQRSLKSLLLTLPSQGVRLLLVPE